MTTRCPEASLTHFAGVNNWPESNLTIRKNNETFFLPDKKETEPEFSRRNINKARVLLMVLTLAMLLTLLMMLE